MTSQNPLPIIQHTVTNMKVSMWANKISLLQTMMKSLTILKTCKAKILRTKTRMKVVMIGKTNHLHTILKGEVAS